MPRPGVSVMVEGSSDPARPLPPDPMPPEPEPMPDPVADFRFLPAAPTTDDDLTLDGSLSTPAEHIVEYRWQQVFPESGEPSTGQPRNVGAQPVGPVVFSLTVTLDDGRSHHRQRGVTVTAA